MEQDRKKANTKVALVLTAVVCFMTGFSFFAFPPLYDIFCEITGLNGKTASVPATIQERPVDINRTVKVKFVANINNQSAWKFYPDVYEMQVHPGQLNETVFHAQNLSGQDKVAQAVPSVVPGAAAVYLHKTECFCFTEQAFTAHEGRAMPLRFVVDPYLPETVEALTLSYTFFAKAPSDIDHIDHVKH